MAATPAAGHVRTMPKDILYKRLSSPKDRAPDKLLGLQKFTNDSSRYCNHELGVE
jgi:hypothetical protein